jgi:hypothetical protein
VWELQTTSLCNRQKFDLHNTESVPHDASVTKPSSGGKLLTKFPPVYYHDKKTCYGTVRIDLYLWPLYSDIICMTEVFVDCFCGLVVRVSGYRSRGPGFDSRRYQIFLTITGSGTGSTQPREDNWGATWMKTEIIGRGDPLCWPRDTLYPQKVGINFADKRRSLGRYSSLAD